jgi:hypothetical protein
VAKAGRTRISVADGTYVAKPLTEYLTAKRARYDAERLYNCALRTMDKLSKRGFLHSSIGAARFAVDTVSV